MATFGGAVKEDAMMNSSTNRRALSALDMDAKIGKNLLKIVQPYHRIHNYEFEHEEKWDDGGKKYE